MKNYLVILTDCSKEFILANDIQEAKLLAQARWANWYGLIDTGEVVGNGVQA